MRIIISLKASKEDIDEISAVLLRQIWDGAEKSEKLCFVGLDDKPFRRDLGLRAP